MEIKLFHEMTLTCYQLIPEKPVGGALHLWPLYRTGGMALMSRLIKWSLLTMERTISNLFYNAIIKYLEENQ